MVELQIISKLLIDKSLLLINQNGITADYFIEYKDEIEFIINHYGQYGNVPDVETFLDKFDDIDLPDVTESSQYLIEKLMEQYMYTKMVPVVHKIADLLLTDATEAVDYMREIAEDFKNKSFTYKEGVDIVKEARSRLDEYKKRADTEGLLGISTGLAELDDVLHGWMTEDFVVILGRLNEGKSWILLLFLTIAWKMGVTVLLYSGEMNSLMVGFRFDTLNSNFSNIGLMNGKKELGTENKPLSVQDYENYTVNLSNNEVPFIVVTPKDIKEDKLTIPTLKSLIDKYNPGIVGIDQISLMSDYRMGKGDPERLQLTHISEDLYKTSEEYGIPILADAQAKRSDKSKKQGNDETPDSDDVYGADGIGQNATRIIAIKQIDGGLRMTIRKNRYGLRNDEFTYFWDIDTGIIKVISANENDSSPDENLDVTDGINAF